MSWRGGHLFVNTLLVIFVPFLGIWCWHLSELHGNLQNIKKNSNKRRLLYQVGRLLRPPLFIYIINKCKCLAKVWMVLEFLGELCLILFMFSVDFGILVIWKLKSWENLSIWPILGMSVLMKKWKQSLTFFYRNMFSKRPQNSIIRGIL